MRKKRSFRIGVVIRAAILLVGALMVTTTTVKAQSVSLSEEFNVPSDIKYPDLDYSRPSNGFFISQTYVAPQRSVNSVRINAQITRPSGRDYCENIYFSYFVYYEDGSSVHGAQAKMGSYSNSICSWDNTVSGRSRNYGIACLNGSVNLTATIPTQLFEYRSGTTRYKYRIHVYGYRLTEDGEETNIKTTDFWSGWRYFVQNR